MTFELVFCGFRRIVRLAFLGQDKSMQNKYSMVRNILIENLRAPTGVVNPLILVSLACFRVALKETLSRLVKEVLLRPLQT